MGIGTRLNWSLFAAPYTVNKEDLIAVLYPSATSAQLQDATHRLNTEDKFAGRMVFDTTTSLPAFAAGPGPTDDWVSADITVGADLTPS